MNTSKRHVVVASPLKTSNNNNNNNGPAPADQPPEQAAAEPERIQPYPTTGLADGPEVTQRTGI